MFIFDVETLGVESTAVIISAGIIHIAPNTKPSYQDMLDNACFVKFDAKEQIDAGRTIDREVLEWWEKQHTYVRKVSFKPSADDVSAKQGIHILQSYVGQFPDNQKQNVWARGSLDQVTIDSLAKKFEVPPIANFNVWRDVRTAIDILYGTSNGYCEVDYPDFQRAAVIKHHPVHDCALDGMMLMYGKQV